MSVGTIEVLNNDGDIVVNAPERWLQCHDIKRRRRAQHPLGEVAATNISEA